MGLDIGISACGASHETHLTHNLLPLAKELGVYELLWKGEIVKWEEIPYEKSDFKKGSRSVCLRADYSHVGTLREAADRIEKWDFQSQFSRTGPITLTNVIRFRDTLLALAQILSEHGELDSAHFSS